MDCQRIRVGDSIYNVPIHYIKDESFVFLEDIHDRLGLEIRTFNVNNQPLGFVRNNQGEREIPMRIRAMVNEIIDCDVPRTAVAHCTTTSRDDIIMAKLDKIIDNTEELKQKANASIKQAYELTEYTVPRFFIILPDQTNKLNPMNLLQNTYRLFFLCECEKLEDRHLAFHEGYTIKQPGEFIKQFGPHLKAMFTIVRYVVRAGGILLPHLSKLSKEIQVPAVFRRSDFTNDLSVQISQVEDMLGETMQGDKCDWSSNSGLEGADLRLLETFLEKKDPYRRWGNLYRTSSPDGTVRWVCLYHSGNAQKKKQQQFEPQFRASGGMIQDNEVTINGDGMKNFDKILGMIDEGLYMMKLTLHECRIPDRLFDKLLTIVSERPNLMCLELSSISILPTFGFTLSHRQVIDKLEKIAKRKGIPLTINYLVEYPKIKSNIDLDLFQYAVKKSSKYLSLQVYTENDGHKIVLKDLTESELLRMIECLPRKDTSITHWCLDKFNHDISDALIKNVAITHLTIFLVRFDHPKILDLQRLLSKKSNLLVLRLSNCSNLSPLVTMLSEELANNNKLETLALNDITDGEQVTELASMLKKNDYLTEFSLALSTKINMQILINLSLALKANRSLKILKLTNIQTGVAHQNSSINLYELFVRNTSIEQLILTFHDQKSKVSLLRETIQNVKNIQTLNLTNCNILSTKKSLDACPMMISNSLVSLSIHSCEFTFQDAVDLFQGLAQNKTLTTLSLDNLFISSSTSDISLSTELATMLKQNSGLKKMTYSHGRLDDRATKQIAEALQNNSTLEELNIRSNRIGDHGAIALVDTLATNNTLVSLILRENKITNKGIERILQNLHSNVTLQYLDIFQQSNSTADAALLNNEKNELLNANEFIHVVML